MVQWSNFYGVIRKTETDLIQKGCYYVNKGPNDLITNKGSPWLKWIQRGEWSCHTVQTFPTMLHKSCLHPFPSSSVQINVAENVK